MILNYRTVKPKGVKKFARPILILHGLLGSINNWTSLSNSLAEKTDRPVVGFDLRNHGLSQSTAHHNRFNEEKPLKMSWPFLVEDLFDTLKEFRKKEEYSSDIMMDLDVIGHSFGGLLSLQMFLANPEFPPIPANIKVSSLVCVDISPRKDGSRMCRLSEPILQAAMKLEQQNNITPFTRRQARNFLFEELMKNPMTMEKAAIIANFIISTNWGPLRMMGVEEKDGVFSSIREGFLIPLVYIASQAFPSLIRDFPDNPAIWKKTFPPNQKVHFIKGALSNYITNIEDIREFIPQASMTTIPDCGHWVHHEKSREFIDDVCRNI